MNEYARLLQKFDREHRPSRASSRSAAEYAADGETIAAEIADLAVQLEGPDREGETPQEKVGRLTRARLQATETVLHQWLGEISELAVEDQVSEMADLHTDLDRIRDLLIDPE